MNKPTYSIILTSYHEPQTLEKAVKSILGQKLPASAELLIISPDKDAEKFTRGKGPLIIKHIRDQGKGKPAALNLGLAQAKGDIVILTDGDVYVGQNSLKKLVEPFRDHKVGAVSGHPVTLNPRYNMLGYWSHFLTDEADRLRREKEKSGQFFDCSGYLYAVRQELIKKIPKFQITQRGQTQIFRAQADPIYGTRARKISGEPRIPDDCLVEDVYLSIQVWSQGYRIVYAPDAIVNVKFPTTLADWTAQKLRTVAGYSQPYLKDAPVMRSFLKESSQGIWDALTYAKTLRELLWTKVLFAARIYVWFRSWWEIRVRKQSLAQIWKRVESTK